ncbi:hypothetical protein [Vampirovibrio sp.]|uniref:hypothetical protein n=1 Tax=Vampirovibrio sp. TaxID=2717857 RepID=UPI0035932BD3
MSSSSEKASANGQYGEMRKKISQVATKALRSAAKSSKTAAAGAVKVSKAINTKPSGKLK